MTNQDLLQLKSYLDEEGRFSHFPGKRQKEKQAMMLRYLAEQFATGRDYTETEVNDILNAHHSFQDPATLRRLMFGMKLLGRTLDGKRYWKVSTESESA